MEKMNDLRDLLKHEISDLHSAEEQIIKALPAMIAKATNPELKNLLKGHLIVTKKQLERLKNFQEELNEPSAGNAIEKKGLLARLFKKSHTCKGMQGLIEEGEKVMDEDMSPEVLDAAIIACAQKIEHYEICGYGTAKAFALELNLATIAKLIDQTLNEEYSADDMLTKLAVERLNKKAENSLEKLENGSNLQPKKSAAKKQKSKADVVEDKQVGKKNTASKSKTTGKRTNGTVGHSNQQTKAAGKKSPQKAAQKSAK